MANSDAVYRKKPPAGGNDNGNAANMGEAVRFLDKSQSAKEPPRAGSEPPNAGFGDVNHGGEPTPPNQSMK